MVLLCPTARALCYYEAEWVDPSGPRAKSGLCSPRPPRRVLLLGHDEDCARLQVTGGGSDMAGRMAESDRRARRG